MVSLGSWLPLLCRVMTLLLSTCLLAEPIAQGKAKAKVFLQENPEIAKDLEAKLRKMLFEPPEADEEVKEANVEARVDEEDEEATVEAIDDAEDDSDSASTEADENDTSGDEKIIG
jgi:hypothetical protein